MPKSPSALRSINGGRRRETWFGVYTGHTVGWSPGDASRTRMARLGEEPRSWLGVRRRRDSPGDLAKCSPKVRCWSGGNEGGGSQPNACPLGASPLSPAATPPHPMRAVYSPDRPPVTGGPLGQAVRCLARPGRYPHPGTGRVRTSGARFSCLPNVPAASYDVIVDCCDVQPAA